MAAIGPRSQPGSYDAPPSARSARLGESPTPAAARPLEIDRLTYSYPDSAPCLRDVDLAVEPGELVLLAGASASGKTTLLRAACGLVPHYHGGELAGEVRVSGRSTRDAGPAELAREVGFVAQEPETQVVSTTVGAELELPLELRGAGPERRGRAVEEVSLALGIGGLLDRTTDSLSGGELQRVAIAAALVTWPPLLLLDEPTSQLDPFAGDELIALLRRLNEDWGVAIVLGEHRLERCLAAADRIVALERGGVLYDGPTSGFGRAALESAPELAPPATRLFAAAGLDQAPVTVKHARRGLARAGILPGAGGRAGSTEGRADPPPGPAALRATGLAVELESETMIRPVLRGVDLEIRAGERVALIGSNGAGKSTLLRACAGLLAPAAGSLETPRGCGLLSQRPDDYLVRERVGDELPGAAGLEALAAAGLEIDPERDPRDLSGGQRQRLALAIAMAGRGGGGSPLPGLICLDEPTRGLDPGRKALLAESIEAMARAGAAVVVATHDVELATAFATRVVLLGAGELIADGRPEELLAEGPYFATDTARITGGAAIGIEGGARLLRSLSARRDALGASR